MLYSWTERGSDMGYLYKSADLLRLEEMEPECNVIDIRMFEGFQRGTIGTWILMNTKVLTSNVILKLLEVKNTETRSDSLPAHIREYVSSGEGEFAYSELQHSTPRLRRPLPAVAFFASNFDNLSCHEIMFRDAIPTIMSQRAEQFIRLMAKLPVHKRNHICTMLKWGQELTHNVQYVLKLRLTELAAELGIELSEMLLPGRLPTFTRTVLTEFTQKITTPWESATSSKYKKSNDMLVETPLFNMVYTVCICHGVAADRLLLLDYSRFAVFSNAETLSEEQRRWLSFFLCASVISQDMAIQQAVLDLTEQGNNTNVLMA